MITSQFFIISLLISVTAFVYSYLLTQPGEIFSWSYSKLDYLFKNDNRYNDGKGAHPLFKILIGCEKCVAGQWSLWLFPFLFEYAFINHILFIGLTIFTTVIIKTIYLKIEL